MNFPIYPIPREELALISGRKMIYSFPDIVRMEIVYRDETGKEVGRLDYCGVDRFSDMLTQEEELMWSIVEQDYVI